MSVAMASLRRVARKCPVLRECQQCIRDSVEFPASSSSTVTSQHNRVAAPCAHFVPRNFHRAVMSPPCSCQRRIARHIEDSGKQLIVLSVDFCAQLVPNDAKRPPGGGGRSRVVRGSCPSWARTRTLLIQSRAGDAFLLRFVPSPCDGVLLDVLSLLRADGVESKPSLSQS